MNNPFTISFGRQPLRFISRLVEINEVTENFSQIPPSNQVFMITGVRGSGKTMMITEIAKRFAEQND
jgi:signal recognition particle GTPase